MISTKALTAPEREEIIKRSAALFPIALALAAITLPPWPSVQAQDAHQEGPIEIEKCQTIDKLGSYKLVKNVTAPNGGACLVIATRFVAIDLAGFTISGSGMEVVQWESVLG